MTSEETERAVGVGLEVGDALVALLREFLTEGP